MQPDEGVGLQPVAPGTVATVDQDHPRVGGVLDERVREAHAEGAGTDDEVVGLEGGSHRSRLDL